MGELADKLRYAMQDGTIRTEILGTAKLILEGCDGVIEYETEKIGLRYHGGRERKRPCTQ